jgi:hypothetical protein
VGERAPERWAQQNFLEWHHGQRERFELVDGPPVTMAGVKHRRDPVVVNPDDPRVLRACPGWADNPVD